MLLKEQGDYMNMNDFGVNLRKLRKDRGYTQLDLAKQLGISRTTITAYEKGSIQPSKQMLVKIASFFNVTIDVLAGVELSDEDNQDIAYNLNSILTNLQNQQNALMFDGKVMDDATRELLITSLKNSLKIAKILENK